jgi:hypothetical protein
MQELKNDLTQVAGKSKKEYSRLLYAKKKFTLQLFMIIYAEQS